MRREGGLGVMRALRWAFVIGFAVASPSSADTWCGNPFECDVDNPKSQCYQPPPEDPVCEPKVCGKCQKSPCFVATGVYSISESDLVIPTAGFPLEVSRSYSSSKLVDGPLGYGWTSNLVPRLHDTVYLLAAPDTVEADVVIVMPDGARYRFLDQGNGTFTPPPGRFDHLAANPDGTFDLTLQHSRSVMHFNSDGTLASRADDYGNTLAYTYDGNGRLEHVEDTGGSGRYLDVYWGADGRIMSVVDHTGRTIGYAYWPSGLLNTVTDPIGRVRTYLPWEGKYVPLLGEIRDNWDRVMTTITYDAKDRVQSYTDEGETWTYTYNYQNDAAKTSKTDSTGHVWVFVHGAGGLVTDVIPPPGSGGATNHVSYNPDGSVLLATDEVGVKTLFMYDSQGRTSSVTYDYQGSTSVRFDYEYNPTFPSQVDAVTPRDPSDGSLDTNWQGWRYEYYPLGSIAPGALRHIYRVRSDGSSSDLLESREYDERGRITAIERPNGGRTDYFYDGFSRVVVRAPSNNDSGTRPATAYEYDGVGRPVSVTDGLQNVSAYTYDLVDRLTSITLPPPEVGSPLVFRTSMDYDTFDPLTGLTYTSVSDPSGHGSRTGYDQFGRPVEAIDPLGYRTLYSYASGLLGSITDAHGYVTAYEYDALRRLHITMFADETQETYSYWSDGLLHTKTDRKGQTITFEYDPLKRLKRKAYPGGSSITHTFEGQKLTRVDDTSADPDETHFLSYDEAFRLIGSTQADRGTVGYSYDLADRVTTLTLTNGPTATYDYYPDGSLSIVEWSEVPGQFRFYYNLRGQEESVTFPSGQERFYQYDLQGRLRHLANQHPTTGNLATFDYAYDFDWDTNAATRLGLRTSLVETAPALSLVNAETKFYYDDRRQLVGANYPSQAPFNGEEHRWSYDAIGNRVARSVNGQGETYSYHHLGSNPSNWQRLLSDGTNGYSFDSNGNVTSVQGPGLNLALAWDFDDRLREINDGGVTELRYDYEGRRVLRTGALAASYVFDRQNRIALLGQQVEFFLFGQSVDELLAVARGGQVKFAVVDGLGSVHGLADSQGQFSAGRVLDAWGEVISGDAADDEPMYTGREALASGFYDYRARVLAPSLGRFLSEDPLRFAAGPSLYRYVSNTPTQAIDPSGLVEGCKPLTGWIDIPPAEWILNRKCSIWGLIHQQAFGLKVRVGCTCTWGLEGELKWYDVYQDQYRELACFPCSRDRDYRRVLVAMDVKRFEPFYTLDGKVRKTYTAGLYTCDGDRGCSCHCRNPNDCPGPPPSRGGPSLRP